MGIAYLLEIGKFDVLFWKPDNRMFGRDDLFNETDNTVSIDNSKEVLCGKGYQWSDVFGTQPR